MRAPPHGTAAAGRAFGVRDAVSRPLTRPVVRDPVRLLVVSADLGRLDMIFQFEHLALWSRNPRAGLDVAGLKRVFGAWQKALAGQGRTPEGSLAARTSPGAPADLRLDQLQARWDALA